jgi:hypothetical protein
MKLLNQSSSQRHGLCKSKLRKLNKFSAELDPSILMMSFSPCIWWSGMNLRSRMLIIKLKERSPNSLRPRKAGLVTQLVNNSSLREMRPLSSKCRSDWPLTLIWRSVYAIRSCKQKGSYLVHEKACRWSIWTAVESSWWAVSESRCTTTSKCMISKPKSGSIRITIMSM